MAHPKSLTEAVKMIEEALHSGGHSYSMDIHLSELGTFSVQVVNIGDVVVETWGHISLTQALMDIATQTITQHRRVFQEMEEK